MRITQVPEDIRELGIVLPEPSQVIGRHFPDYLIVGPWRTGTTWLSEMLRRHEQVFMTEPKETLFFSHLQGNHKVMVPKEFSWYLDLFEQATTGKQMRLLGEGSATYATRLTPEIIRCIYQINPAIKIIFGIRHPVERTLSHARMNFVVEPETFDHLTDAEKYALALSREYILDASFYTKHLKKWCSEIPTEQIYLFQFDQLKRDPVQAFNHVCDFLGIESNLPDITRLAGEVGKVADTSPSGVQGSMIRRLQKMYRHEITALRQQYHVQFEENPDYKDLSPLVVVNKLEQGPSETFITNHVTYLHADVLRLKEYEPLDNSATMNGLRPLIRRWRANRNIRKLHNDLQKQPRSILIEYGTNAVKALPALRGLRNRIVIHFHGYDAHQKHVVETNREAYRELFALADAIVVVSEKMRQALMDLGARPEKLHHIVCGVELHQFQPTDVSANPAVFFACGRFVEKKAPHLTIRAFHQAWIKNPQLRLRMAGQGAMLEDCKALVATLNLSEVVRFLGAVDHDQVAEELRSCRAFLQHSVVAADGDSEGTPVTILEAGCCAVPVISTKHAGIVDVVIDGETGMLCEEGDVEAMADAIGYLATHPVEAGIMGRAALKFVSEKYTMQQSIEKLSTLLKRTSYADD